MLKFYIKNTLLLSTFLLSQLHTLFRGDKQRVDWSLLIDHSRRIDYAVMYMSIAINFLILAFCLHYPKGVNKNVTRFILIITILDMLHLVLFSKIGFGMAKIGIAFVVYLLYEFIFRGNGNNKMAL
jgi:hypothetical protein